MTTPRLIAALFALGACSSTSSDAQPRSPSTAEAAPPPEDATPVHGSADWLAAGVAGDDDQDDSASRRAKTRNQAL